MGEWDVPHLTNLDHELMPYVDLCNIACGGHAGNRDIIEHTIELAKKAEVEVGAHPGYEDRENFGRMYQSLSKSHLSDLFTSQIDLFLDVCGQMEVVPYHIKPHGALYHACNHHEFEMNVLVDLLKQKYSHLTLLVFPNSLLHKRASEEELNVLSESFVDRRYTDELKLASRNDEGAVITSVKDALQQYTYLCNGVIVTEGNFTQKLSTQTACIHGDNPQSFDILKAINSNG